MPRDYPKMVGWYSPKLLLKAAVEVVISTIFGQHADQRTVQALTGQARISDYSNGARKDVAITPRLVPYIAEGEPKDADEAVESKSPDFWFDYVADTGDGWDSTYSVAHLVTRTQLSVDSPDKSTKHTLPQGQLLVFGGDEVYPTASREEYDRRFIGPYQTALSDGASRRTLDVFAIPGNHDWYDSLRSFSRIFFTDGPFVSVPGLKSETPQTRSYFAIKLPSNWWLLGTDVQLGSDIDANQLEYFRTVASQFGNSDKVILCTAEPHWVTAKKAQKRESITEPTALDRLEQEVLGSKVRVFVAGDVHHYMRFESEGDSSNQIHKITAGGGGAFLHPTHRSWDRTITEPTIDPNCTPRTLTRPASAIFPPERISWLLSLRNGLFTLINPRFGVATALLYVVFALMMMPAIIRHEENVEKAEQQLLESQKDALQQQFVAEVREYMRLASITPAPPALNPRVTDPLATGDHLLEDPVRLDFVQSSQSRKEMLDQVAASFSTSPTVGADSSDAVTQAQQKYLDIQELDARLDRVDESISAVTQGDYVSKVSRSFLRQSDRRRAPENIEGQQPLGHADSAAATIPGDNSDATRAAQQSEGSESAFSWLFCYLLELGKQEAALPDPFLSMLAVLVFLSLFGGFIAFTDLPNLILRVVLGTAHGCAHWLAAFIITLTAFPLLDAAWSYVCYSVAVFGVLVTIAYVVTSDQPRTTVVRKALTPVAVFVPLTFLLLYLAGKPDLRNSVVAIMVFVGGWMVGSVIMGCYLFFAHAICGQHWNEAFSSIKCKDWKCFLRFHISGSGELTIYPVGIRKTCRKWAEDENHVYPANGASIQPALIEDPLVLT